MPNGTRVKQYKPSGPIKVVRGADSSSNSIVWKASETSTMVNTLAFFKRGSFSSIVVMVYTGLRIALFIVWLRSIHILIFPLGFSFTSMFDNQSVGCATSLIVPLSQRLDNFIELGHWNATSGSMDRCNTRVHFYTQRVSEGLPTPWFEDIRVALKDVLFSDWSQYEMRGWVLYDIISHMNLGAKIFKN